MENNRHFIRESKSLISSRASTPRQDAIITMKSAD